jgi:hypothetical protein
MRDNNAVKSDVRVIIATVCHNKVECFYAFSASIANFQVSGFQILVNELARSHSMDLQVNIH